jgi:ADP-ribose pyrophosphatase
MLKSGTSAYIMKRSRLVYKNKWLKVYEEILVNKSSGRSATFNKLETHDVAVVLPIFEDGSLLVVEVYRHAIRRKLLGLPGGFIEDNERPADAARRELTEETGYTCGLLKKKGWFYAWPASSTQKVHVFAATGLRLAQKKKVEEFEYTRPKQISKEQIIKEIEVGSIRNATTISAIALAYLLPMHK